MHSHIHFSKMIEVLCNTSLIYLLIYLSIYLIMMTAERGGHYRHPRNVLPVIYSLLQLLHLLFNTPDNMQHLSEFRLGLRHE